MTRFLYILCEGELDEMFYERLAERVTGLTFEIPADFRVRAGSNWKTALAAARLLIDRVSAWEGRQDIGIIIALDNDRAPGHPGADAHPRALPPADLKKPARYPSLTRMLTERLGDDRAAWPVDVAMAMPVEMIESWVLTLLDPARASSLPIFAESSQRSAQQYHGGNAPPQLKDLRDAEAQRLGISRLELLWRAAESDLSPAAAASRSLEMFVDDLKAW